jgi:hypothetical protein
MEEEEESAQRWCVRACLRGRRNWLAGLGGLWSIFELFQGAGKMARVDDPSMPDEVKCKQGMILRFW